MSQARTMELLDLDRVWAAPHDGKIVLEDWLRAAVTSRFNCGAQRTSIVSAPEGCGVGAIRWWLRPDPRVESASEPPDSGTGAAGATN